jgi:hypothetical protein
MFRSIGSGRHARCAGAHKIVQFRPTSRSVDWVLFLASDHRQASSGTRAEARMAATVSTSAGMAGSITLRDHALALTRRSLLRRRS